MWCSRPTALVLLSFCWMSKSLWSDCSGFRSPAAGCRVFRPSPLPANQGVKYAVSQFRVCILWRIQSSRSSEAESFRETLLTSSVVVKCDGLAFGAFPGCVTRCFTLTSWFLPPRPARVTTYATWCRHIRSVFLIFRAREESWDMRGHEG